MSKSKYAWSWADYERCKRAEERKAARAAAKAKKSGEFQTADTTRGCEGRVAVMEEAATPRPNVSRRSPEGVVRPPKTRQACVEYEPRPQPQTAEWRGDRRPLLARMREATPGAKIDISAAPSGMEEGAARWKGVGPAPMEPAPLPEAARGQVMCRCGSRFGKGHGPVPFWFGDKCIEGDCPLRKIARRKVAA